jgi:arylsulfatase A
MLMVCNTQTDGHSLVAAGHLRRQKSSTYLSRPLVSSLYLTYWYGEITHHFSCYKPLDEIRQMWVTRMSIVLLVLLTAVQTGARTQQDRPPNILLLVSDDQGYRDLGCFGNDSIKTPHLDRLAEGGICLTSFYVTWPACTPSRGSLLTGRYPQRNGIYDMIRNEAPDYGYQYPPAEYRISFERIGGMDTREVLLPKLLKAGGYTSGIYGKWDLGVHKRFLPLARGFDDFYGFCNTGIDYFLHERYGVPSMYRNNSPTTEDKGTYCTYLFQREAVRFLKQNHDRPFFLYVPFNAPHNASNLDPKIRAGAQAPDRYKAMYPDLLAQADYQEGTQYGKPALKPNRALRRLEYMASITCMDDAIGELLGLVDEYGIADNTIVIFFSDNGGGGPSDNTPLKGHKGWMFEGGTRVPCIVRYPGTIPAGTRTDAFLTSMEIVPTLLKATHSPLPGGLILDGYDMMPVLAHGAPSPRTEMFWQRRADKAARAGHWKWVESAKGNGLYDLSRDIGEQHDLSQDRPDKLREMKARFKRWCREMDKAEPRGPFRDY